MAIFKGYGVVWDAEKDKPLVRFVKGEIEVNDPVIAAKLADMGYQYTGDLPEAPKEPEETEETTEEKTEETKETKAPKKPKQASK